MTKIITIFGGSGFVGRYMVKQLAAQGHRIRVACRSPEHASHLKLAGNTGQIELVRANLRDGNSIQSAISGSDVVINLVGILYEKGKQSFDEVHAKGAERIAQSCSKAGIAQLIHMSALGVDQPSGSYYARSKLNGEKAVKAAYKNATILRPSIIFGEEDGFFNRFAAMAIISPFLPLIGGGKTKFQPVYVVDVARAVVNIIATPSLQGKTYELGGPTTYRFRRLMRHLLNETNRRCWLLPVPFSIAKLLGLGLQLLPTPPLTVDQIRLLKVDNTVSGDLPGFAELQVTPQSIHDIIPRYLARYRKL